MIDGAICFPSSSAATHEQPGPSTTVCVREEEGEWSKGRRGSRWFFYAMNLTCFPDLIYVNSTCRLWDRAFNTSDHNFMAYLLWKYLDGKSHSVFKLNNIPVLHRWGFYKADLHVVKLSPDSFMARSYCMFPYMKKKKTFHLKCELNFSLVISCSGKNPYSPKHHCLMLIQHGCHHCPAALNVESTVELEHWAKRNKQSWWSGAV